MTVRNYTTTISVGKTIAQIQQQLADHGALRVSVSYRDRVPACITCALPTPLGERTFAIAADVGGTYRMLERELERRRIPPRYVSREQAARICWRTIAEWLAASVAMLEAGVAGMDQLLFAYMLPPGGEQAVYEAYMTHGMKLLGEGGGDRG